MYLLLTIISLIVLIITRIYLIISQQNIKKRKIGDNLLIQKYKLNEININFGSKLYQKLKAEKRFNFIPNLYSKSPENGINYCVNYIDTKLSEETDEEVVKKPTFVLLHGSPGTVDDFDLFLKQFGQKFRIIIPQLPDFEFSRKTEQFWHSNEERVDFVLSFLRSIDVEEVDCLICHSGGNPIALQIVSGEIESKIIIKSLVMITSPPINWLNSYQLKNSRILAKIGSNFWKRYLFLILWPDWLSVFFGIHKTIIKNTTKDDFFWMTFIVALSEFELNIKRRFECLAQKQIPTLYVMAEKDGLFPKYKYLKTLDVIDCNREEFFTHINIDGIQESDDNSKSWFRVLNFRFGGHFCFKKYSQVFHNQFIKFFESLNI